MGQRSGGGRVVERSTHVPFAIAPLYDEQPPDVVERYQETRCCKPPSPGAEGEERASKRARGRGGAQERGERRGDGRGGRASGGESVK